MHALAPMQWLSAVHLIPSAQGPQECPPQSIPTSSPSRTPLLHEKQYFWAVRDFKYLWRSTHTGINSSVMWWDARRFEQIWQEFSTQDLDRIMRQYHGDQDYISTRVTQNQRRFLDSNSVVSWRWQCQDGGYDFRRRRGHAPGTGTQIPVSASVLVFHGSPKPDKITDQVVQQHWQ